MPADPARSFRDPSGFVTVTREGVFRSITTAGISDFAGVEATGLLASLVGSGRLWPYADAPVRAEAAPHGFDTVRTLTHPPLPFVSFPYEWSFSALKKAALFHLDVQIEALESGIVLKDATPFNVQFVCGAPVFIDHLSFRPYVEGEYWIAHAQFHDQFFGPLLLEQATGVAVSTFYRGNPEGLAGSDVLGLLPLRQRLSPYVFANLSLPARLARRATASRTGPRRPLPKSAYGHLLRSARGAVEKLRSGIDRSVWGDYADHNTYSDADAQLKRRFIGEAVAASKPATLLDIGCNTGDYSVVALEAGAQQAIGLDIDPLAIDKAFARAAAGNLAFMPLVANFASPTPGMGWANRERLPLLARTRADFVLALALIHHLVFGRNIPMAEAVTCLLAQAPEGIIEFVPPADPMVKVVAAGREAMFPHYSEEMFRAVIATQAAIVAEQRIREDGRLLVHYRKAR